MPSFRRLQEFDLEGGEDWVQYMERMKHYFVANDTDNADKRKALLLSACGGATYKSMCGLLAPAKPGDNTFHELKEAVKNHLQPKPSEIMQPFKFHTLLLMIKSLCQITSHNYAICPRSVILVHHWILC
ncbi:hypothetical protein ACOMHN_048104 [Nucella lapillus]